MAIATVPGYPRIGAHRELKWALEGYWSGKRTADDLAQTAHEVRQANWTAQRAAGLDLVPVNDFSLYDHVLDTAALVGAVPYRYGWSEDTVDLDTLFAMARGRAGARPARAMEMTKWFDTNYHYLVPEFLPGQRFRLASDKPFAELAEAQAAGIPAKPTLLGPFTFLLLGKGAEDGVEPFSLLDALLPVYAEVIRRLADAGAEWIQLDEPALVLDRAPADLAALERAYTALAAAKGNAKLLVQTSFGHVGDAYQTLASLPIDGLGLDFVRGPENLDLIARHGFPADKWLAAGVVDGRNVWVNDLTASLDLLDRIQTHVPRERLMISSSCSLLHVPYDVRAETDLDPTVRSWLAFAAQKLDEIVALTRAVNGGRPAIADFLTANATLLADRHRSSLRHNPAVQERLAQLTTGAEARTSPYPVRAESQQRRLNLPLLPTTTIGSFPQTSDLRVARRRFETGEIDEAAYDRFLEDQIRDVVRWQEGLGLDVLVHGEPERNDMVQYFGEQLAGFAFTHHGWVQSYGSRCVRPPIIYGDVHRPGPMTVRWAAFAQSLTARPVKGMLTGPVTILNWSFVRDDQPRAETCRQIAPAIRDETQIHTHMCYSEFGDVIDAIAALDADVISIENARSDNELLRTFRHHGYDKGIGPGVYDIHSPRIPSRDEIVASLRATLEVLDPFQVWVNPDCGLKTRRWEEVRPALENMVEAARELREALVPAGR
jgi:5-methyltetrahydropteroyltriglutamate--homocysteine methyltransferase